MWINSNIVLLRFLRPACSVENVRDVVREIGVVRHENVVPLVTVYVGGRGEKLLVHPFYGGGNLAEFIRDRKGVGWKWDMIYEISLGIVKGLCHLHSGLSKQIIHGNLKSKNILLDENRQPYVSDYGLHLLLNPIAGQEMLETSAGQGYKAPELIKMKNVNESTDVFILGVILLELVTGKEPINGNPSVSQEFYLPDAIRSAVLERRFHDLYYHSDLLMGQSGHQRMIIKDRILKLVQLAITCCSPSPHLRPSSKEILQKLEEIGTE
ncbi:putative inactive leucine-rich repeat receptor-like protein [Drosera capensis]